MEKAAAKDNAKKDAESVKAEDDSATKAGSKRKGRGEGKSIKVMMKKKQSAEEEVVVEEPLPAKKIEPAKEPEVKMPAPKPTKPETYTVDANRKLPADPTKKPKKRIYNPVIEGNILKRKEQAMAHAEETSKAAG